jgi:hypothetical protein
MLSRRCVIWLQLGDKIGGIKRGGGGEAKSSNDEKAWSSINQSILSRYNLPMGERGKKGRGMEQSHPTARMPGPL